jgi:hypothetical protein
MRKLRILLAAMFAISATIAIAAPASAAPLAQTWLHEPHENTKCPVGTAYGIWHFVNNQTDGSIPTGIWVKDENDWAHPWHPLTSANKKVRHFWVVGPVWVKKAYVRDGGIGKLVLSEYTCVPGCTPG